MQKLPLLIGLGLLIFFIGRYIYLKPKFTNGQIAPEFSATLQNGEAFKLSDLKGKYVLLDFWGSWCAPCRQMSPTLVDVYKEFNQAKFKEANGLEIVSIAIEQKQDKWLKAIEQDGLNWKYHIAEFDNFNSPIAKSYGVKEIPTTYLINEKGMIIGVNLRYDHLHKLLADRRIN